MTRRVVDPTLYNRLELETCSTLAEIQKRYYELALKYHPDKNPGQESKWKELVEAYTILKDEETRQIYDNYGMQGYQNSILSKVEKQNSENGSYIPLVDPEQRNEDDKRSWFSKMLTGCKRRYFSCRESIKNFTSLSCAMWIFGLITTTGLGILIYCLVTGWYLNSKSSIGIDDDVKGLNQNSTIRIPNNTFLKQTED